MTKVSAVMALYNTPFVYLQKTVDSILAQTLTDFELIVVDDASQLEYAEFFKQFNDNRIKYIKLSENAGPGHARNIGIKKSTGDYVAIVDSDDIYKQNRFEVQSRFLDNNVDISLISCAFEQSNNGKIPEVIEHYEDIKLFMLFNSPFANPAVMFRRPIFLINNLFYPEDKNFGEDYELWINAMLSGVKMANLKDVLMIYTRRSGQLSNAKAEMQIEILKSLYKKLLLSLKISPTNEELDLQYKIYQGNFDKVKPISISCWFDRIIEHNKKFKIFDEQRLIAKKAEILIRVSKFQKRLFKIKIGAKNLCVEKTLRIYLEDRD